MFPFRGKQRLYQSCLCDLLFQKNICEFWTVRNQLWLAGDQHHNIEIFWLYQNNPCVLAGAGKSAVINKRSKSLKWNLLGRISPGSAHKRKDGPKEVKGASKAGRWTQQCASSPCGTDSAVLRGHWEHGGQWGLTPWGVWRGHCCRCNLSCSRVPEWKGSWREAEAKHHESPLVKVAVEVPAIREARAMWQPAQPQVYRGASLSRLEKLYC